jgi:hypothetical protein
MSVNSADTCGTHDDIVGVGNLGHGDDARIAALERGAPRPTRVR